MPCATSPNSSSSPPDADAVGLIHRAHPPPDAAPVPSTSPITPNSSATTNPRPTTTPPTPLSAGPLPDPRPTPYPPGTSPCFSFIHARTVSMQRGAPPRKALPSHPLRHASLRGTRSSSRTPAARGDGSSIIGLLRCVLFRAKQRLRTPPNTIPTLNSMRPVLLPTGPLAARRPRLFSPAFP